MSFLESAGAVTTANFNKNTAATHEAVAAHSVATLKPRLIACNLVASGAVTVTIKAAAVTLYGPVDLPANGCLNLPPSPGGWGDGAANTAINVVLGGAVQVGGAIVVQHIN